MYVIFCFFKDGIDGYIVNRRVRGLDFRNTKGTTAPKKYIVFLLAMRLSTHSLL